MELDAFVEGRNIRNKTAEVSANCYKNEVVLRVDDEENPAFWLQVTLTREQLQRMLVEMDNAE